MSYIIKMLILMPFYALMFLCYTHIQLVSTFPTNVSGLVEPLKGASFKVYLDNHEYNRKDNEGFIVAQFSNESETIQDCKRRCIMSRPRCVSMSFCQPNKAGMVQCTLSILRIEETWNGSSSFVKPSNGCQIWKVSYLTDWMSNSELDKKINRLNINEDTSSTTTPSPDSGSKPEEVPGWKKFMKALLIIVVIVILLFMSMTYLRPILKERGCWPSCC